MTPQQQRSEETRQRILAAAEDCFARNGYDGTGVALICQEAGVSKGAFYHHFASKQAVFLSLLDAWLARLDDQLAEMSVEAADVPLRLMSMAAMVEPILKIPSQQLLLYLEFLNATARDAEVWQATIAPYHHYRDFLAKMIAEGIAQGRLRPVDAQATANIIIGLIFGLLIQGFLDPSGADWSRVTEEAFRAILGGLEAQQT